MLVESLIITAKILVLFRNLVVYLSLLIWRPIRAVIRFFFYKIAVKLYGFYLTLVKKSGWKRTRGNVVNFFVSERTVHVILASLVLIILGVNIFFSQAQAGVPENQSGMILSSLVKSEFTDTSSGVTLEEADQTGATIVRKVSPTTGGFLNSRNQVSFQNQDDDSDIGALTQNGSAIVKQEVVSVSKIKRPRSGIIFYTVQAGDTISTIADNFDISVNTILWENGLNATSWLKPGQELAILPVSGVSYKVVKGDNLGKISGLFNVSTETILAANNLRDAGQLKIGAKLIIPGGTKLSYAKQSSGVLSGVSAAKQIITTISKAPQSAPAAAGGMNWPAEGHRITQYFSWRHTGLDIANKIGTTIYAADSGKVVSAGWNRGGYGNFIVLDHGGGKLTRYAHLSKFYVKAGDRVTKGQAIGAMGSTGRSTGSHLHFELRINGVFYNPLNYVR